MRELEFLPEWYPRLRRRKRLVVLQGWLTIAVIGGLSLWMFLAHRNVRAAEGSLAGIENQLQQAGAQVQKLNEMHELKKRWVHQDDILRQMGPHVPAARMFDALQELMPPEMALLDLTVVNEEVAASNSGLVGAQGTPAVDRRLRVTIHGVTPTDVDLGNFLAKLTSVPYFGNIAMGYAQDRVDDGRAMREFETTFTVDLNDSGGQ
jgi:hypothetical protein